MFSKIKLSPVIVAIVNQNSYSPFLSHMHIQANAASAQPCDAMMHMLLLNGCQLYKLDFSVLFA
jgi:hypothetical protein